jgi:hypothetical protein
MTLIAEKTPPQDVSHGWITNLNEILFAYIPFSPYLARKSLEPDENAGSPDTVNHNIIPQDSCDKLYNNKTLFYRFYR